MKVYIYLGPLLAILLAACGAERSEPDLQSGHAPAPPAEQGAAPSPAPADPAKSDLPLQERLGSLGFQTPTAELPATDFTLRDLSGRDTALGSFAGRVVLLNFWATWCGPCRAEIPSMQRLYAELDREGLTILAVNSQERPEQVAGFAEEFGMSFPVLLDTSGKIGAAYGVRAIPTTYLINPRGLVVARMVGTRDWYTPEIVSLLRELLP